MHTVACNRCGVVDEHQHVGKLHASCGGILKLVKVSERIEKLTYTAVLEQRIESLKLTLGLIQAGAQDESIRDLITTAFDTDTRLQTNSSHLKKD
jgi:hypothetical protein